MHLQSLELFGFKSFADKTVFNFHEGVTAVVGPNGCGKSNVLDAVRWVLGEQSAKALRGGEMADVIFNGTDSRKPVGFAEVSLTFTDCAQELGVDWHDVRVTRRVYRDGNSEYLLNKNVCRLKDIQALFADTGIGRSAYSMMEQGRIDQILSSRPEDRRAVFEEAAGITKYKGQKKEALRKLEATEANLLRLGDIIKEVKRQIGSLQRQAGKARRYQALMADLHVLDTHHSRAQLDLLEAEMERSRTATTRFDEDQRKTESAIEEKENEVAAHRGRLEEVDAQINAARTEVQRLQNEIASHRNRIEFNRERAQELSSLIERYEGDITTAEGKLAQQETEIHDTDLLLSETERLLAAKQTELDRAERPRRRSAPRTRGKRTRTADDRARHFESGKPARRSGIGNRRHRLAPRRDRAASVGARAVVRRRRWRARPHREPARRQQGERGRATRSAARPGGANSRGGRRTQPPAATAARSRNRAHDERPRDRRTAVASRNFAATQRRGRRPDRRLAGHPARTRRSLPHPARLTGALASLIEVEEQFIPAVEAALGRNLHAIVLQNSELASEIIATVSARKLGQTALIVPELSASAPADTGELPPGAIAWATEKVHAPEALQPIVRHLLGEVVLVNDLDQAQRLKREFPALAFATLAGDLVSSKGVIYGGRVNEENSSLFARKVQIASLAAEHRALLDDRQILQTRREEIDAGLAEKAERLEQLREQHQAARGDHSAAALLITTVERELHEAARKVDALEWERTTLDQQLTSSAERVKQLEEEAGTQRVFPRGSAPAPNEFAVSGRDRAAAR